MVMTGKSMKTTESMIGYSENLDGAVGEGKWEGKNKKWSSYRANNPPAVPSLEDGTPVWYSARSWDERPAAAAAAAA